MWVAKGPVLGDPPRHQLVQRPLDSCADVLIPHPPVDLGIRFPRGRRVDVHTTDELGFITIEERVVERPVRLDLILVVLQIFLILLASQRGRRPAPRGPVSRPQPLARAHHRGHVQVYVSTANGTQVVTRWQLNLCWMHPTFGKPVQPAPPRSASGKSTSSAVALLRLRDHPFPHFPSPRLRPRPRRLRPLRHPRRRPLRPRRSRPLRRPPPPHRRRPHPCPRRRPRPPRFRPLPPPPARRSRARQRAPRRSFP